MNKPRPISNYALDKIRAKINPSFRSHNFVLWLVHIIVLALSLGIIVFISYDTFQGIPFLKNHTYMTFQFWVCIVFLLDFFLELILSDNRKSYIRFHWFYLLISIPYLNLIELWGVPLGTETLYYIRFIPLIRGAYALAMVVGYFSSDKAISLITQYAVILLSIIYFSSLIFFYVEKDVNSNVNSYWDSLYWAFMNVDTVGSEITAVTPVGKVLAIVLALSGMMMLPLFTVYITAKVKEYNLRRQKETWKLTETLHDGHKGLDGPPDSPGAPKN